jgi:predicted ferric reductase
VAQYVTFITSFEDVSKAALATGMFVAVVFFSIYIVRRKLRYETWYFIHLLTYLAILLAFGHQLQVGSDFTPKSAFSYYWYGLYAFVLGSHALFRFIVPVLKNFNHGFYVDTIVRENSDTTSIYISGKNLHNFSIQPGQFMNIRFLSAAHWWQSHPFSLSSAPDKKHIRITIKNVGDFTSAVGSIAKNTPVFIDGPYGIFTLSNRRQDKLLLLASGIGITPIRALLEDAVAQNLDVVLLYGCRTKEDLVFKKELDALGKKSKITIHYILSRENNYPKNVSGRIDREKIKSLVKDYKNREVYLCGPVAMLDSLQKEVTTLGIEKSLIHFEKFSLR